MVNVHSIMSTLDNLRGERERVLYAEELSRFTIVISIDK